MRYLLLHDTLGARCKWRAPLLPGFTMGFSVHRSFETITRSDLRRLAMLARDDLHDFFRRYPRWRPYADRLELMCLCQGAARHYLEPGRIPESKRDGGVADFDVWAFFRHRERDRPFPPRRHGFQDFGPSKFGRNADDDPRFIGRRVDVLGRSISVRRGETIDGALQRYFTEGRSQSARRLAVRPAVVLWPNNRCGEVVWRGKA